MLVYDVFRLDSGILHLSIIAALGESLECVGIPLGSAHLLTAHVHFHFATVSHMT